MGGEVPARSHGTSSRRPEAADGSRPFRGTEFVGEPTPRRGENVNGMAEVSRTSRRETTGRHRGGLSRPTVFVHSDGRKSSGSGRESGK